MKRAWSATIATIALGAIAGTPAAAQYAYIPNSLGDDVSVIDTATETVVDVIAGVQGPQGVEVHPDGTRLYVGNNGVNGEGNTISVVDLATHEIVSTIDLGADGGPEGMGMYPDGSKLYVASGKIHNLPPDTTPDSVAVVDLATESVSTVIQVDDHPWDVEVSPDGSRVWVVNAHAETLMVIDPETETITHELQLGDGLRKGRDHHTAVVLLSPDGSEVWVAHMHEDIVSVIDSATVTVKAQIDLRDPECPERPPDGSKSQKCEHTMGMAFHPDGSKFYIGRFFRDELSVLDAATHAELARIPVRRGPKALAMHPDGTRLYVGNQFDNMVTVLDTATDSILTEIPVGSQPIPFGRFFGPLQRITGRVTGLDAPQVVCRNETTGEQVRATVAGRWWDCEEGGLVASPGDTVKVTIVGVRDAHLEAGGTFTGLDPSFRVSCSNRTAGGGFVQFLADYGAPWWNCEDQGLVAQPGEEILMAVRSVVAAPPALPVRATDPRPLAGVPPPPHRPDPYCPPNGAGGCDFCAVNPDV